MRQPTCIAYVRLSRDSEASTSVASQTAACREYADRNGWRVLFVAEDVDVSGASKLEDRPGMARVLAALSSADYVISAKLDRYARSVLEFSRLLHATEDSGTILVTADGTLSPTTSKLVVHVLSAFAEFERDQIKARITTSKEQLRAEGRWLGGAAPYGYRIVQRDGGKYLAIDDVAAAVVRDVADRLINKGATLSGITRSLNENGVLPPADHARQRDGRPIRGAKWSTTTLRDVLITPAVRGWLCQAPADKPRCAANLVPVLDAKGEPQRVGPELLNAATHDTLCSVIAQRAVGRGSKRTGKALLLHIAECAECGGPMYHQKRAVRGKDYSNYVCPNGVGKHGGHVSNIVNAAGLEQQVSADFLRRFGFFNQMREVVHAGRDVQREIREVEAALDNLGAQLEKLTGAAADVVGQRMNSLAEKLANLRAHDAEPAGSEWVPTGRTVAEEWAQRDTDGRRSMLVELGAMVTVKPLQAGAERRFSEERASVDFEGPAWWLADPAAAEAYAAVEWELS